MPLRRPAIVVLPAIIASGLAFLVHREQWNAQSPQLDPTERLEISRIDFGPARIPADDPAAVAIWEQAEVPVEILLYNPTRGSVQLKSIEASCDCLTPQADRLPSLPPGGRDRIRVQYRPKLEPWREGQLQQPFRTRLAIVSEGPAAPWHDRREVVLEGEIRRAIELDETSIDLGTFCENEPPGRRNLGWICHVPGASVEWKLDDASISAGIELQAGPRQLQIRLDPRRQSNDGIHIGRLEGTIRDATQEQMGSIALPVRFGIARFRVQPEEVVFGVVEARQPRSETVRIGFRNGKRWRLQSLRCTDPWITLETDPITPEGLTLRITPRLSRSGDHQGTIQIDLRDEADQLGSISLPVRAYGAAGQ